MPDSRPQFLKEALDHDQITARLPGRPDHDESPAVWRHVVEAAQLRERAAGLRAPEDPGGFTGLARAAVLRHRIGQSLSAGDLLERAGDQAIARGDVVNASWAYINAGFVAAELRDQARAREGFTKGMLLMRSPLLSAAQREWLQGLVAPAGPRLGGEVAEVADVAEVAAAAHR
jgi:hypothetical protein